MMERVPIAEFATEVSRPVALDPSVHYKSVGVKWYGAGVHVHEVREGHLFEADRFQIQTNDIIYNDMWARMGSVAIVPTALSGAVASSHFPTFQVDQSRALPAYLSWYFRSPPFWDDCELASRGSTGRNQIKRKTFLAIEIPLPPLDEQRRIVARIEELAAKVEEARGLRSTTANEANYVWQRYAARLFSSVMPTKPPSLDDVAHIVGGQSLPEMIPVPVEAGEIHLVKVSDMNRAGNEIYIQSSALSLPANSPLLRGIRISPKGAVILPKRGGAIATNKKRILTCSAALDPNLMAIFPRDNSELSSSYLFAWLKTIDLASMQDGTSVPQINKGDLAPLAFPFIPLTDQQRVVAELDSLQTKVDDVKALQTETAAELDAMLPAILDKAFKGKL